MSVDLPLTMHGSLPPSRQLGMLSPAQRQDPHAASGHCYGADRWNTVADHVAAGRVESVGKLSRFSLRTRLSGNSEWNLLKNT
jgi:hypothetical protein